MTTQYKTSKDAKDVVNLLTEGANQVIAGTTSIVEEMADVVSQVTTDNRTLLASHQKLFRDSFEIWQNYSQTSQAFAVEATQRTLEQALVIQQNLGTLFVDSLKRNQTLFEIEQAAVFDAFDAFQAQFKATSEWMAKNFNIPAVN